MTDSRKNLSLFIVLLVAFIDWMGLSLVYPIFSSMLFHPEFGFLPLEATDVLRGFWLGFLLSVMPIAQFFTSPLFGAISDQKGRKPTLKIAMIIGIFGYLLSTLGIWQKSLLILLFGRILVGISAGSAAIVAAVIADLSRPEDKAKNFALLSMACGIGFTMGSFLGGKLSTPNFFGWGGFEIPFLFSALAIFLNLLLLIYFFKETHYALKEIALSINMGLKNGIKAFRLEGIRTLFISVFVFCFGWSFFWEFIPVTWIGKYNLNASQIGDFFAYGAALYALSCGLLIRPIVKWLNNSFILFSALILLGISILLLLLNIHLNWLWGYIPFQQFFVALIFPTAAAMVSNWVKDDIQGEIMGVLQSVQSAAFALSPLISGVFVGLSFNMPIIIGGIAMLIAAFIFSIGNFHNISKILKN